MVWVYSGAGYRRFRAHWSLEFEFDTDFLDEVSGEESNSDNYSD